MDDRLRQAHPRDVLRSRGLHDGERRHRDQGEEKKLVARSRPSGTGRDRRAGSDERPHGCALGAVVFANERPNAASAAASTIAAAPIRPTPTQPNTVFWNQPASCDDEPCSTNERSFVQTRRAVVLVRVHRGRPGEQRPPSRRRSRRAASTARRHSPRRRPARGRPRGTAAPERGTAARRIAAVRAGVAGRRATRKARVTAAQSAASARRPLRQSRKSPTAAATSTGETTSRPRLPTKHELDPVERGRVDPEEAPPAI